MARIGYTRVTVLLGIPLILGLSACQTSPPDPATSLPGVWVPLFDGRSLDGWKVATEEGIPGFGEPLVEKGMIVLEMGEPMTGIAWTGDFPRTNYEVSLEASRLEGYDFFCGMTFPVGEDFCTLIVGGWGGSVVGLSNVDDMAADSNSTTQIIDFENDRWYRVKLQVTDGAITAWLDDEQVIQQEREGHQFSIWPEQEPARPFGVATWNTKSALRSFVMRRLEGR